MHGKEKHVNLTNMQEQIKEKEEGHELEREQKQGRTEKNACRRSNRTRKNV